MAAPFARRRDGGVDVTLAEHEATLVRSIVEQMDQAVDLLLEATKSYK